MATLQSRTGLVIGILLAALLLSSGLSYAATGYGVSSILTIDNRFSFPVYDMEEDSLLGYVVYLCGSDADPVNTATGNFTHDETDLSIATRSIPLQFSRYYNSMDSKDGPLGIGWTHAYNISLTSSTDTSGTHIAVRWGDGRTDYWLSDGTGGYAPDMPGLHDTLELNGSDWKLTRKNKDVYLFDNAGKLKTFADKNGNTFTLNYNGSSQLTSVADPSGRALTMTYHADGKLATLADIAGRTIQYQYTSGKLTQVTNPFGHTVVYTYTAQGWLATIKDQRGVTTISNTYDSQGRVIQQTDGRGYITTFTYGTEGTYKKTTIGYPDGTSNDHLHSENNLLLMIRYPQGSVHYAYDDDMNRTQIIDRNGNVTNFIYDTRGNVLATMDPNDLEDPHDGGLTSVTYGDDRFPDLPTQKTDTLGQRTSWVYDAKGNCITETDAMGNTTQWTYNTFGQKLTETNKNGDITTFEYNPAGQLIRTIDALGNATQFSYDTLWRLTQITDACGNSTQTTYDVLDRVLKIEKPLFSLSYTYDAIGNRLTQTNPKGKTTQNAYDNNSNLVSVTDALSNITTLTYDGLNRKTKMTDAKGNITQYAYDNMGRLISETDAEGHVKTLTYDAQGNILTRTDGSGVTLFYTYDSLNRVIKQADELGNTQLLEYDKIGQLTKTTDAKGNITQYLYDVLGRLTSVIDPKGLATDYQYDPMGNVRVVIDAGNRTIYDKTYDALGRLVESADGNGNVEYKGYDSVGNLISETDANGNVTNYVYDAENRLIDKIYQNGTHVAYTYDANGNLLTVQNPTGITTFVYDALDRLISSMDAYGKTVSYSYDSIGNRTGITYPADAVNPSRNVTYVYDKTNRLDKITDWSSRVWDYTLDAAGRITQLTYPNGVKKKQTFDNAGRLSELLYTKSDNTEIVAYRYTRDALGNPVNANETGTLLPDVTELTKTVQMSFDADNRLIQANSGIYSYDKIGNVTSIDRQGQITQFAYNDENRLISKTTGTSTVQHIYDGLENRIARVDNGTSTRYVLGYGSDISHVLCETDVSGNITAYYIQGPEVVGRIAGTDQKYYHTDPVGSVIALTEGTGVISDRYAYTPFGSPAGREGTTANPFTYVGGYGVMTEEDGLYFMRARFFESQTGRFLGKDPVEGSLQQPMSLYRYNYALGNPQIYVDPSGLVSWNNVGWGVLHVVSGGAGMIAGTAAAIVTSPTGIGAVACGAGVVLSTSTFYKGIKELNAGFNDDNTSQTSLIQDSASGYYLMGASAGLWDENQKSLETVQKYTSYVETAANIAVAGYNLYNNGHFISAGHTGGGGKFQFTWSNGQYMDQNLGWIRTVGRFSGALSLGISTANLINNVPAFYDPKLNVYYVNGKTKKIK